MSKTKDPPRKRPRRPNHGAQLLRRWLDENDKTRAWLAKRLDVSAIAASMWTTGRMVPRARMAISLRDLCGIPIEAWWQPEESGRLGEASARRRTGRKAA